MIKSGFVETQAVASEIQQEWSALRARHDDAIQSLQRVIFILEQDGNDCMTKRDAAISVVRDFFETERTVKVDCDDKT